MDSPGMSLDPRDRILQDHTPAVMVPRYGEHALLGQAGHRYLVAEDGLWLEIHRPWLHLRALIAPIATDGIQTPFGRVSPELGWGGREFDTAYAFGNDDLERLQSLFLRDAKAAMPNEFAAWGIWNEQTRRLEYRALIASEATPGSITFPRPRLEAHEHLALDLHSHGTMDAFFSSTDDADDAGEVKISVVVGNLDREPTWQTRLCALGLFLTGDKVTAYGEEA